MRDFRSVSWLRWMAAAATATVGVASALAITSDAQASWTPIVTLTASTWQGDSPVVSADKNGDFLLAWAGINNKTPDCYSYIQLRTRSRTGSFGPVQTLTPCGPPMSFPAVASSPGGYGIVAWVRGDNHAIQARLVSPAGKAGPVLTVTPKYNQTSTVSVAMSPTGQALVLWEGRQTQGTGPNGILGRFITPNGALGPVLEIGGGMSQTPSVVFDSTGTATVAWSDVSFSRAMAQRITPQKTLGKTEVILAPAPATAATTSFSVPQIADDSSGDTFLVTSVNVSSTTRQVKHLVFRKWSKSGALGPAVTVANPVDDTALTADGAGDTVIAWSNYVNSTTSDVYARRISHTGSLGPAVKLGTGFLPRAAVAAAGSGIITWQSTPFDSGLPTKLYGRLVSATAGSFGPLLTLTSNGMYAQVAEDAAGKFGVIWEGSTIGYRVYARFGP
jgi:hypothetical protein